MNDNFRSHSVATFYDVPCLRWGYGVSWLLPVFCFIFILMQDESFLFDLIIHLT